MRATAILSLALLTVVPLLAGCSQAPNAPAEIVVESRPPDEVRSNDTVAAVFTPAPKTRGHIAGVVVDAAIRPIEGARVKLPGLDLERTTDRDGSFGFVDLHPGPYFITAEAPGYYPAEAVLHVGEDEFTRAKVILTSIPPPDPYHVTQSFEGFADATDGSVFSTGLLCGACNFDFYADRPGLHTLLVEATMDGGVSGDGFEHWLDGFNGTQRERLSSGSSGNPMRVELRDADLGEGDRFELRVYPTSFPAPQASKRFQVFVTAFYNEGPPTGWSIVGGDQ